MKYPFLDLEKVNRPYMDLLHQAALDVISSGRYIGGGQVEEFEQMLRQMHSVDHAVGVSNGLDALRLILRAYIINGDLKPGDQVIVPANTYIATILAITDASLVPVLADVDLRTMNLSAATIEQVLNPRVKAIMLVHLYGRVAWDEDIRQIISTNGLIAIEDCAQAIGGRSAVEGLHGAHHAGALGHAGALSFYPTKNVGALGDAGAVLTHDARLAKTIRALANYGSDIRYHNIYQGFNCRLDPIQAAFLKVKLPFADRENADRHQRAMAYSHTISHPDIVTPVMSQTLVDNVWHQYVIRITNRDRDYFRRQLLENGVGTDVHYPVPPHMQPCYKIRLSNHIPLPNTERLSAEVVSLPISTGTTVAQAVEISNIINTL